MRRIDTLGKALALAVISATALAAAAAAEPPGRIAAAVDGAFRPLMTQHDVPGMAVAVTVDGRHHVFTYGVASKQTRAPVTRDTLFEIGSVSKPFTATLASYAQVRGRLSLDDHPGKYMPQLRGSAIDNATLLHLATYTAGGLPLQLPAGVTSDATLATYLRQWKPSAAPGAQRRYSNPSIGLLGHLTALALNGTFADLMEAELFTGLGLTRTHLRIPAARMADDASGYNAAGKPVRVAPGVLGLEAYGIRSSAADLIRFVEANIRPETLEPPLRRAIEGTHVGYFKVGGMTQGLGWEQYPWPIALDRLLAGNSSAMIYQANAAAPLAPRPPAQPALFNKTGSTNGFAAYVAFVPAQRIGIVVLANKVIPIPARITAAHAVLTQLAADPR